MFQRPQWDISFYLNTDAASLIGTDTFKNGEVTLRRGPIYQCAVEGGFGVLDEINMAKNESLSVLHATLDFRRIIDVPGYDRITLSPCTRFIATMNYGYAGTRELNEALASRFMVINMPVISADSLEKLLKATFPKLRAEYARQLAELFQEIRKKCDSSEISTKALDLRGLTAAVREAVSLDDLYTRLKTKRYPHARLRRLVLDAALGFPAELPMPPYLHVLGARKAALPRLKQASLPAATALADLARTGPEAAKISRLHNKAVDFSSLCREKIQPMGLAFTAKPVVI